MCGLVDAFGMVVDPLPSPPELIDVQTSSAPMVADDGLA
jgi:hypothetical protein